ncbi:hypothetical protein KY290_037848 [Solanum tuberosum]|uniref:AAA+ ATPase domain-containing protein n=1 Tax=Solanum tuberosum TaxID=4113 RepID=A0ABQ7TYK8_SOLTU|nr:hypothetical protein KY284_037223 [Solanum tuberosum]KAH0739143.1 hypothetical protein KY290_037848 [Solanum tuberosum]
MGEIVLSAVITKATEAAGNLLLEKWSNLNSLEESINWLKTEMKLIQSYIIDARTKLNEGDSRVKNLIKYIEQLAGDADDILDEFLPKIEHKGTIGCRVCNVSSANKFVAEIEKIKRRVAEIDRLRTTYGITDTSNNNNQHDYIPLDQRGLFLHADETEVIGLDDDFNKLQAKLLDHDMPYGVVSIVGMPGLGKTTLAKKLYRHVRHQFECSGLVYVSQQARAGEILQDIAKQVGLMEQERKRELGRQPKLTLEKKKPRAGEILPDMAKQVGVTQNDYLEENLRSLLKTKRSIVGRCGGVPLAIVVTAGMLRARERTEHAWNRVLESMGHKVQDGCAKVLALSFNEIRAFD